MSYRRPLRKNKNTTIRDTLNLYFSYVDNRVLFCSKTYKGWPRRLFLKDVMKLFKTVLSTRSFNISTLGNTRRIVSIFKADSSRRWSGENVWKWKVRWLWLWMISTTFRFFLGVIIFGLYKEEKDIDTITHRRTQSPSLFFSHGDKLWHWFKDIFFLWLRIWKMKDKKLHQLWDLNLYT